MPLPRLTALPLALALLFALAPGLARGESPIPAYPQDGVAVSADVQDTFEGLRAYLAGREGQLEASGSGAEFRVCVVAYSDPHNRAGAEFSGSTVQYVDQVFAAWRGELDPDKHVVIALALENRGVAVHPGSDWARLGFEQ